MDRCKSRSGGLCYVPAGKYRKFSGVFSTFISILESGQRILEAETWFAIESAEYAAIF